MVLFVLATLSMCCLVGGSVTPFAVFGEVADAAIIAGIFSTVNVVLNAMMIQYLRRTRSDVNHVKDDMSDVKMVTDKVKLRKTDRTTGRVTDSHDVQVEGEQA